MPNDVLDSLMERLCEAEDAQREGKENKHKTKRIQTKIIILNTKKKEMQQE